MINTHPPEGTIHPSTTDHNPVHLHVQKSPADLGPSPVDAIPAGETRANMDTTHAGNYAYTSLPNSDEGNVTDPHKGEKGYLDMAKEAMSPTTGYLAGAMAAVGLGGAAVASEEKKHEMPEGTTVAKETPAVKIPEHKPSEGENMLAGPLSSPDVTTSHHGPDQDVQTALAKAEGRATPKFDETYGHTHDEDKTGGQPVEVSLCIEGC